MSLTKEDLKSISNLMDDKIGVLTKLTQQGFVDSDKKTDEKIDSLARLTAKGFDEVSGKILESEERTKGIIKSEVRSLENTVNSNHGAMVSEFIKINGRIDKTDDRTMKDQNVMAGDIVNLDKRVSKLEKLKAGQRG